MLTESLVKNSLALSVEHTCVLEHKNGRLPPKPSIKVLTLAACDGCLTMKAFPQSIIRPILKIGAFLCVGLGVVGIFLPLLPTTPLLILATVLSYNASPKLRQWLLSHPVFGEAIRDYLEHRRISAITLRKALITLWLCLLLSIYLVSLLWVGIALVTLGVMVSCYLVSLARTR